MKLDELCKQIPIALPLRIPFSFARKSIVSSMWFRKAFSDFCQHDVASAFVPTPPLGRDRGPAAGIADAFLSPNTPIPISSPVRGERDRVRGYSTYTFFDVVYFKK